MIWVTGDTHSDFHRFNMESFPEQKEMTRDDYMIILGDFGGVWDLNESKNEKYWLDWLENKSYTTLFIDGNHENYDRLYKYPSRYWNGGVVNEIRPHVLHLHRGYVFDINGITFFTFGGARSHDIEGGVFEYDDPDIKHKMKLASKRGLSFRVNHVSWWEQEMPNDAEKALGLINLEAKGNKVDFVLSHDCPASTLALFSHGTYKPDELNIYLDDVRAKTEFKRWFFGHYHDDRQINAQEIMLFEQIVRIA